MPSCSFHLAADRAFWPAMERVQAGRVAPSLGGPVAHAAVAGRTDSPRHGLDLLEALPTERERFQPYHAVRGDLLARLGRHEDAAAAYAQAVGLTTDPAVRAFLTTRRSPGKMSDEAGTV
ncbi:hypothetical protein ABZW11_08025 [Nonomuraea sp. NPDC004580]|uniref:hypothetical protein n=1 Tax=Nonomuraea sp. NPDC004580 TaxID=3154552 RepID=UPI0033A89FA6